MFSPETDRLLGVPNASSSVRLIFLHALRRSIAHGGLKLADGHGFGTQLVCLYGRIG